MQFKYNVLNLKNNKKMKILKENPKLSASIIVTIILELWTLFSDNVELFNIQGDTLAKISVIVSMISLVWKQVKPEESLFTMAYKSIGGGGIKNPPKDDEEIGG